MNVLLGISGGIAAYKAPEVVRALRRNGHAVRCVLTASGARLVAKDALAAVSGEAVHDSAWPGAGAPWHDYVTGWLLQVAYAMLFLIFAATGAGKLWGLDARRRKGR